MADYQNNSIPSVLKQDNQTLADLLALHGKQINLNLNCHAVATIRSFDAATQTCEAEIAYTMVFLRQEANGSIYEESVNYPLIVGCPVVTLTGGNAFLSMPIEAGDTCLLLFNDRSIENWYASGGQVMPPSTSQTHAIGDAIALVGLRHNANPIPSFDQTRARLQKGAAYVGVGNGDKVKIANDVKTLKELLDAATGILNILNTLNAALVVPTGIDAGTKAAVAAAIIALNTQMGSLLE